jgi:hypothetical protein
MSTTPKPIYISSYVTDDLLIEMVYSPSKRETRLAAFDGGEVTYHESLTLGDVALKPVHPRNDLLQSSVVLFPSMVVEYDNEKKLMEEIQQFIHRYLDITPFFEKLASYYVLLSWVYDMFNEVPYLRALGDYGTGKTRFLQVIGHLCYKPTLAGGATTVSPIFRLLHEHRGTLILDEADYQFSDMTADIVKILNNGYARGFPVLRTEGQGGRFIVRAFDVFTPKIIATREKFKDKALESRFLVETMGGRAIRDDIPDSLPPHFQDEARLMRDKLLLWRFRNFKRNFVPEPVRGVSIERRLRQIIQPIWNLMDTAAMREELKQFVTNYAQEMIADRGMSREADALGALLRCAHAGAGEVSIKQITNAFNDEVEEQETVSHKKMGWMLRERLGLKTQRREQGYVVFLPDNREKIASLKEKYGLSESDQQGSPKDMSVGEDGEGDSKQEMGLRDLTSF